MRLRRALTLQPNAIEAAVGKSGRSVRIRRPAWPKKRLFRIRENGADNMNGRTGGDSLLRAAKDALYALEHLSHGVHLVAVDELREAIRNAEREQQSRCRRDTGPGFPDVGA